MSVIISGVSVLLMIFIHLFSYPSWLLPGIELMPLFGKDGEQIVRVLCCFGGICVYTFAFMSGYSLIVSRRSYATPHMRLRRLMKFLLVYWFVLSLFLSAGLISGARMPSVGELACNSVGLKTGVDIPWVNVPFAWYVAFYIEFMICAPGLLRLFGGKLIVIDVIALSAVTVAVYAVRNLIPGGPWSTLSPTVFPFLPACVGILVAKYGLLEKVHAKMTANFHVAAILLLAAAIIMTPWLVHNANPGGGRNWSFFGVCVKTMLAPVWVLCVAALFERVKSSVVYRAMGVVGSLSVYLWFLHGMFFTGGRILQPYLYAPKAPILVFALCVIVLIPAAIAVRKVINAAFDFMTPHQALRHHI